MPHRAKNVEMAQKFLHHEFQDRELIVMALTHPSLDGNTNYQRLEFLGDRVLGLVISEWLYELFPDEKEGALSRRHHALVRKESLADVALSMDIGPLVIMAQGTENEGGRDNPGVLADVMKAMIGALFLDAGLKPAKAFIRKHWEKRITEDKAIKDNKSALQEWAQGRGLPAPVYRVVERTGPDHQPRFVIEVEVKGNGQTQAEAGSKRAAETEAAGLMLTALKDVK